MQAQNCIDIEQIKVDLSNIDDKCNCVDPIVLGSPNQTTNISTYQLGQRVVNECIWIYGTLVIDQEVHFASCDLNFGSGALIRVNDNMVPISFIGCNLQSCGNYSWDGIELGFGNTLFFINNTMQHSFSGIHNFISSGPTVAYFVNNVFNDNRNAISLGDHTYTQNRSALTLSGNIFGQTDDLKPHWDGNIYPGDLISHGVKARYSIVNALIGSFPCERTNIFVGLHSGYTLQVCISNIDGNLFHDFHDDSNDCIYTNTYHGWDGASSLIQRGWPTNDIETFNNVTKAIYSVGTSSDIKNNIIKGANSGILSYAPSMVNIINNNEIQTNLGYGIKVFQSNVNSEILENYIDIKHDPNAGTYNDDAIGIIIYAPEPNHPQPIRSHGISAGTKILENTINLDAGYMGIQTMGAHVNLYNISCNTINIKETIDDYASGIEIVGGYQNVLGENNITGLYSSSTASEINGIKIIESQENLLRANYTKSTITGLHFSNWNNHTRQLWNTFENHDYGYFIGESGVTGPQFFSGNKWEGSFNNWAAFNDGDHDMSRYYDYQNLINTVCWPETIDPDPGWFWDIPGTGICSGTTISNCNLVVEEELDFLTYVDTLVARGELEFDDFEDDRKWQAERYLLRNLTQFPDLVGSSGSLMDSFLIDAQSSVLWDYHKLRVDIEEYSTIPSYLAEDWFNNYELYLDLMDEAEVAIDDWLTHPDSLELAEFISDVNEEIDSVWTMSFDAFQSWREGYVDALTNLLPNILALSTPNTYAANEKVIMLATVKMAQGKDSVNSSLRATLFQLAESCLLENGPAVIEATVILHQLKASPARFDLNCVESTGQRRVDPEQITSSTFEVYPNPTSGNFTLNFNSQPNQEGMLEVYDLNGKLMHSSKVESTLSSQEFSADHLPSGHYYIKVSFNGVGDSRPLIISK